MSVCRMMRLSLLHQKRFKVYFHQKSKDATCFTQFVADNVHRNLVTLDGKGRFTDNTDHQ